MADKSSRVLVVGGGLAGLAAAAALGSSGYEVRVLESRPYLGGRATSYALPNTTETIDNCQHVLLRCCTNLLDFYRRLQVQDKVEFHREFYWIEPGGRVSTMQRGWLPAPAHFTESFFKLRFLSLADKIAVARGLLAVRSEYKTRKDLDSVTMMDWLREKRQTGRAIERFWRQVLVSAINEDLERMAALHGLQVFYAGFLADARAYQMGVPAVPLGDLYSERAWSHLPAVTIDLRAAVEELQTNGGQITGVRLSDQTITADKYILAVPFERVTKLLAGFPCDLSAFSHSPITGIHLWFDRPVTDLPHATLLDRTMQWMFNKKEGRHIQLVVSASRGLIDMGRNEVVALALKELAEFFPGARAAKLERSHVVKEVRATFSAAPGLEKQRPVNKTNFSNLFLAGDWTRSGWPATMEGAVRSGYLAAEAVTASNGTAQSFLCGECVIGEASAARRSSCEYMRIGITCYPTYGGSGIVATELGLELARRGHEVHFISYAHPIRLTTNTPGIHYHEVEVSTYPLFQYPPYVMALASRMAEIAEHQRLDLLTVHYAIPHSVAAYLAREMSKPRRLPFVTTLHGTDITIVGADPSYFRTTQFAIEQSDGITTISEYMRHQTLDFFGVRKPIEVIHNFVNCSVYRPSKEESTGRRKRILHISNFRPVKRVTDCLRAFALVRKEVDAELLMAGDGPERGPAERLAHELGISADVRFLGKQDHVEKLIPQTDALHLPSETEAFGLAALEAMACGVPPVATRTGGVPDLITHGHDGYMEPVADVEAQARRLTELLSNDGLRTQMAKNARETALRRFCTELVIPQYEKYYQQVCEGGN